MLLRILPLLFIGNIIQSMELSVKYPSLITLLTINNFLSYKLGKDEAQKLQFQVLHHPTMVSSNKTLTQGGTIISLAPTQELNTFWLSPYMDEELGKAVFPIAREISVFCAFNLLNMTGQQKYFKQLGQDAPSSQLKEFGEEFALELLTTDELKKFKDGMKTSGLNTITPYKTTYQRTQKEIYKKSIAQLDGLVELSRRDIENTRKKPHAHFPPRKKIA